MPVQLTIRRSQARRKRGCGDCECGSSIYLAVTWPTAALHLEEKIKQSTFSRREHLDPEVI